MLFLADDKPGTILGKAFNTSLPETLILTDDEIFTEQDFSITLDEILTFVDEELDTTKSTAYETFLPEILILTDDEILTNQHFSITLDVILTFGDEEIFTEQDFSITLDEILTFGDGEQLDTTKSTAYETLLPETLNLIDETLLIAKNGIIQLGLSEMLFLADD